MNAVRELETSLPGIPDAAKPLSRVDTSKIFIAGHFEKNEKKKSGVKYPTSRSPQI